MSREAMEERMRLHERKLRKDRMTFRVGQITIMTAAAMAASMRSYPWNEIIRLSSLTMWVMLYHTSYAQRGRTGRAGVALGMDPSVHPLVDFYRDSLSTRHDFYRHASFLTVPFLVVGILALPAFGAVMEGSESGLLLIPYGILLSLSFALYTIRRRTELPKIEREIREIDDYRRLNPLG